MGTEEFRCNYCGSRNRVNQEVVLFVDRHRGFASGPARLVEPLTGLVQAIASLRSRKSADMDRLASQLRAILKEHEEAVSFSNAAKANMSEARTRAEAAIFRAAFALISVILIFLWLQGAVQLPWYKKILPLIVTGMIVCAGGGASIAAALLSLFSYKVGVLACAVAGSWSLREFWYYPTLVKAASKACDIKESELTTAERELKARAEEVFAAHRPLISVALEFLNCLYVFRALEDEIPIGVRMDHAVSALNDMTFSSIVEDCEGLKNVIERTESALKLSLDDVKFRNT